MTRTLSQLLTVAFITLLLFMGCTVSEDTMITNEQHEEPGDVYDENIIVAATTPTEDEPIVLNMPILLTVESIPYGTDPADFLRELGYDSFAEHEFMRSGPDWIVLRTNTQIPDLRIIAVIPHYDAVFDNGWQFMRHYTSSPWTRLEITLLPDEPFVMAWHSNEQGITEWGLDGISFTDVCGYERFFILRHDGDVTYLEAFEKNPRQPDSPLVSVKHLRSKVDIERVVCALHQPGCLVEQRFSATRPNCSAANGGMDVSVVHSPSDIELVAAWIIDWHVDTQNAKNNFLQQFYAYTTLDNPYSHANSWVIFGANTNLYDFQFFRVGQVCDPWVDDEFHLFYVGALIDSQDILAFGEPIVVPWHPGGTMPGFGIRFLDKDGQRHNFTLNANEGSGFPPMFILSFVDRIYCPHCA